MSTSDNLYTLNRQLSFLTVLDKMGRDISFPILLVICELSYCQNKKKEERDYIERGGLVWGL